MASVSNTSNTNLTKNNVTDNANNDGASSEAGILPPYLDAEAQQQTLSPSDKTAALVGVHSRVNVTAEDDRRVVRKIDQRILPILLTVYFLQQLDKSAMSYASIFGILDDAHLNNENYSWLSSIVYFPQLFLQPLVAYFLVKVPTGYFLASMVLGWGVVLSAMAAADTFKSLMATRFFLGAFEATVAPTFVAVTQMWWRRSEQTKRNAYWYAMNGVVNMVGSLLAFGLGHIQSKALHPWQIIFLFCGLVTVVVSLYVFIFMPNSPVDARFLSDRDRLVAVERLRANQMGVVSNEWKWSQVRECLLDPKSFFWFALIFSISVPSGGITAFGPLIISTFVSNKFDTILYNIPFGAIQLIATLGGAWVATHYKKKGPILAALCLPPIAGCVILLCFSHIAKHKAPLLVGYYLVSFYPGISPLIYSWSAQNTAGETKKKCVTAIIFIGQSAGNIIGPHLYNTNEKPGYTRGLVSNLVLFILLIVLTGLTTLYLAFLNRRHEKKREGLGKNKVVEDRSMMSRDELTRAEQRESLTEMEGTDWMIEGKARNANVRDKAFADETDIKNEDFIYVF